MGLGVRILKNTTYLTFGDKIGYILQFIFFLYFARMFGVIPTGEYSFGYTFAYAFAVFVDLGISVYLVREVARSPTSDRKLFFDCLVLRTSLIILVTLLALVVLVFFLGDISAQKLRVIAFWGGYWIFFSLADVFIAELNGHEKMGQVALLGICLKLMSTIAGILLMHLGFEYDIVLIVLPISSFLYLCACIFVSFHYLGAIQVKFGNVTYYKKLIVQLLPFFFAGILINILWCQDILILGFMQDDNSVGIYSSGIKIMSFILGISPFFHIAMLPVLSKLFIESKEKLIDLSTKILRYLVLISLPISFGLTMTSDKIIDILYSDLFKDASIVLKVSSWAIAAGLTSVIFSGLLTAINRQKEKVIFIGINFIISTLLNVFFIYNFNYVGAAIVKLITMVISLIFFMYLVFRYLALLSIFKSTVKPAIACVIMTLFIRFFYHCNIIYLIPLAGLIYVISLLILGGFTKEEISFVKNFVFRKIFNRKFISFGE